MRRFDVNLLIGILLVLIGIVVLISNLNLLPITGPLLFTLVFALIGFAFMAVFVTSRENWWAIIPGFALLGLAVVTALPVLKSPVIESWGGGILLACIGASFLVIYAFHRDHWWAIIPAGTLLTLAAVVVAPEGVPWLAQTSVFFLGLALTFGLLYLVPTANGRMTWAVFPATGLLLTGLAMSLFSTQYLGLVWPILLVLAGVFLLFRTMGGQR